MEKVYERALVHELGLRGLKVASQASMKVAYKGQPIGTYVADLIIEDRLVVELKCTDQLANHHTAQLLNYLRASNLKLGLLINFQRPKVDWKRVIL